LSPAQLPVMRWSLLLQAPAVEAFDGPDADSVRVVVKAIGNIRAAERR